MAKTNFLEYGTVVTSKFLNAIFGQGKDGGHKHDGINEDGHCGLIDREQVSPDIISGMALMGQIVAYAGSSAPDGWLICDGEPVPEDVRYDDFRTWIGSNASYLIEQIQGGTVYRKPNLSGRIIVGAGQNVGDNSFSIGATGGEYEHTLKIEELAEHSHRSLTYTRSGYTRDGSGNAVSYTGSGGMPEGGTLGENLTFDSGEIGTIGDETELNGYGRETPTLIKAEANKPHNNIQPYFCVNYIIRAV